MGKPLRALMNGIPGAADKNLQSDAQSGQLNEGLQFHLAYSDSTVCLEAYLQLVKHRTEQDSATSCS